MIGWLTALRRKVRYHCPKCGHDWGAAGVCPMDKTPLQRVDY